MNEFQKILIHSAFMGSTVNYHYSAVIKFITALSVSALTIKGTHFIYSVSFLGPILQKELQARIDLCLKHCNHSNYTVPLA